MPDLTRILILILATMIAFGSAALAESPQDRAAKLKEWREKCNDPDPDLRLAQLEAAIATQDTTVMRTCIRQALRSDQADMRNLGLRAAMAMKERIVFQMTLPENVTTELAKAGSSEKAQNSIRRKFGYTINPFESVGGTFTFVRIRAEVADGISQWNTLGLNPEVSKNLAATISITGDQAHASGNVYVSGDNNFRMQLRLSNEGDLVGKVNFGRSEPISVRAKLL